MGHATRLQSISPALCSHLAAGCVGGLSWQARAALNIRAQVPAPASSLASRAATYSLAESSRGACSRSTPSGGIGEVRSLMAVGRQGKGKGEMSRRCGGAMPAAAAVRQLQHPAPPTPLRSVCAAAMLLIRPAAVQGAAATGGAQAGVRPEGAAYGRWPIKHNAIDPGRHRRGLIAFRQRPRGIGGGGGGSMRDAPYVDTASQGRPMATRGSGQVHQRNMPGLAQWGINVEIVSRSRMQRRRCAHRHLAGCWAPCTECGAAPPFLAVDSLPWF